MTTSNYEERCGTKAKKGPSVIMTVLIDDLGFADAQVHNANTPTPHLGTLAKAGVTLVRDCEWP